MKYLLSLFVFIFSSEIIAQELSVSGKILDEKKQPISFANVLLFNENDTILNGVSSNDDGEFNFKNLEKKNYKIKISYIGFKDYSEAFSLEESKYFKSIILIEDTQTLEGVTINTTIPTIKKEADKLVFNVENSALSEGNLLEVLKSTPGVLVLGEAITVKNSTPTVYINDRKVNLSSSEITQLLENSPANTIKEIEVITNPPAKYDADSGVVLNIIMSRNLITGYRGNVFSNYTQGVFPRYNAGINQFYKTNKINLNLNYSFTKSKINRDNNDRVNYLDNSGSLDQKWDTNTNRNTSSNAHNINLNFDYFVDDNNSLSFSANTLVLPFYDYRINGNTLVTDNSSTRLFNFNSFNHSKDDKYNLAFDIDYEHKFKAKGRISFNTHYTDYNYHRNQSVNSNYFFPDTNNNFNTAFNTLSNQDTSIISSQVDYSLPIDDSSEFVLGIKSSNIKTDSNINQFDIDTSNGNSVLNTGNSNAYEYEEFIFSAYTSYSKDWDKWSFNGGLRVEQTNVDGLSVSNNVENNQDYFEFFPTLNLSREITDNFTVYTNYKRSISRPSYQLLNPFNFFLNDNTVVTGNPVLMPEFNNKYLLGTTLYDFLTIEVFYKTNRDAIYELPVQDNNNNIISFTPTNITKSREYGLDIEFYKNLTDRWFLYAANSFSNSSETMNINNTELKLGRWYNFSILNTSHTFLKDNSLSVNFAVTNISKVISGLQTVDPILFTDLSLKKTLKNKKTSISLAISDLFNTQDYMVTNKYLNQDSFSFTDQDTRYIKFGFSHKFGNTTLETNERTKAIKERDRLEK